MIAGCVSTQKILNTTLSSPSQHDSASHSLSNNVPTQPAASTPPSIFPPAQLHLVRDPISPSAGNSQALDQASEKSKSTQAIPANATSPRGDVRSHQDPDLPSTSVPQRTLFQEQITPTQRPHRVAALREFRMIYASKDDIFGGVFDDN